MGKPHQLQRRNSGIYAQGVGQGARGKHKPGSKCCKNYDEELIKKNCFYGTHAGYCRSSGTYSIIPFQPEMLFLHFFASFLLMRVLTLTETSEHAIHIVRNKPPLELKEVQQGSVHNSAAPVLGNQQCICTGSCLAIKLCAKQCFHGLDRAREQVHRFTVSLPHARVTEARAETHKMSHTIEDNILPMYEI
jgi:hypothetical protein